MPEIFQPRSALVISQIRTLHKKNRNTEMILILPIRNTLGHILSHVLLSKIAMPWLHGIFLLYLERKISIDHF